MLHMQIFRFVALHVGCLPSELAHEAGWYSNRPRVLLHLLLTSEKQTENISTSCIFLFVEKCQTTEMTLEPEIWEQYIICEEMVEHVIMADRVKS